MMVQIQKIKLSYSTIIWRGKYWPNRSDWWGKWQIENEELEKSTAMDPRSSKLIGTCVQMTEKFRLLKLIHLYTELHLNTLKTRTISTKHSNYTVTTQSE